MRKIIVLGAGITGLATALGLTERGVKVDVYEAGDVAGGLAGSEEIDGMFQFSQRNVEQKRTRINEQGREKRWI